MAMFYTFYSFKGGVGRSMALANVADLMARRGLRVLAIDFDLEAPGLERYFQVEKTAALSNPGLIDLLLSFKQSLSGNAAVDAVAEFRQLRRFIFPVYQQPLANGGQLHLLTAGQRAPGERYRQYALAVRTFDWQDFYYNWEGEAFFEWLRGALAADYDVVLVDSRTGVTEMGGVCAYQLADAIVMLCAANHQNVEGTRDVASDFKSEQVRALRRGRALELIVVPARIEQHDPALLEKFFRRFDEFFKNEEPQVFSQAGLSFRDLTIPYQPEYAFEEVVVSDPERRAARRQIGGAFDLLGNALTLLALPGQERLGDFHAAAQLQIQQWLARHAAPGAAADALPAATTRFDPTRRFAGYDVFLSFGEADAEMARALAGALEAADLGVFLDRSALTAGAEIAEASAQALHHSRALLICAGSRGVAPWQKRIIELARASNQLIRVIPVLLAGAEADIFSLALRGVADTQSFDLRQWPQRDAELHLLVQALHDSARPAAVPVVAAPDNPYLGLAAYDESQVHLLALADAMVGRLVGLLRQTGLARLSGASGCGKSSLAAAVIASYRQSAPEAADAPLVLQLKANDPAAAAQLQAGAGRLRLLVVDGLDSFAAALRPPESASLWPQWLQEAIRAAAPAQPLLLIGNDLPLAVWRQLPSPDAALWARLQAATEVLRAPDTAMVRRAVETPAARSGFAFEPGLLDRVVQDIGEGPGALPLAQMVLAGIWSRVQRGFLTNAAYDEVGGVAGVFVAHLQARLAELPEPLQLPASALLLRLVKLGDDGGYLWHSSVWEQVRSQSSLTSQGAEALLWLLRARVLNVWRTAPDLLCFSLLRPVAASACARLDALIEAERLRLGMRQRLIASLALWQVRQHPAALLDGARLDEARSLQADWPTQLCAAERDYIARSEAVRQRRRQREISYAVAGLVALGVVGLIGLWINARNLTRIDTQGQDLQAATAVIKAAVARNEAGGKKSAVELTELKSARVYPQFADDSDKRVVNALGFAMRALDLQVEPAQLVKEVPTCGEVRYFYLADQTSAQQLQEVAGDLLRTLGIEFELSLMDLSGKSFPLAKPGHLELWLPPLGSLAIQREVPARGAVDGAELRKVPGGCASLGSRSADRHALAKQLGLPYQAFYDYDNPWHRPWLDGFLIYAHEVTNEQFGKFMQACALDKSWHCPARWSAAQAHEPARFISWRAADSYCHWAGGRLPSEDEWEKAARGDDGRIWPWGNQNDPSRYHGKEMTGCPDDRKKCVLKDVGSYPEGASPYGVYDMAGSLWELTATPWEGGGHVMKGGSYLNPLMQVRSAWRWANANEAVGDDSLGFRCVIDLPRLRAGADQ